MEEKKAEDGTMSSDSGLVLSPILSKPEEGSESLLGKKQENREAQSAPHVAAERSDGGTPTRRQRRRDRPTKSQYKGINSFAEDFGPSLLKMMDEDEGFMEEVNISIRNERFLHDLANGKSSGDFLLDGLAADCRERLSLAEKETGVSLSDEMMEEAVVTMLKLAIIGMEELETKAKEGVANA